MRRFVAISLALHLLAVAGLLAWWRSRPAREAATRVTAPIELSLVEVERPAPPPPAPASAPPPPPAPRAPRPPPDPEPAPAEPALEPPGVEAPAAEPEPATELARAAEPAPPAAPSAPPQAPAPARPSGEELARVRARIEAALRYPNRARRRGWEGTAIVRFRIADGRATEVELVTPTGHAPLDAEAVEVLERAAPYPPVPGTLEIPVTFALR